MTSIWGAGTAGGTMTTTMRFPVDTSSTSGPTYEQGLDIMNGVLGNIVAGANITLTPDTVNGKLTIASSGGGSGGSGTVNSGTAGQLAAYTASGTAVSGIPISYDTTVASPINWFLFQPGAAGSGVTIIPALTGADTSASLTLKAAGTSQYAAVLGTSTLSLSYNGSTTQRLLMTTSALTIGSGLAVTISSTLTVTGQSTHNGFTVHASGLSAPTRAITASTTTATTDYAIFASGTGVTVTLHTPTVGQLLNVKNTNTSGGAAITLSGTNDYGTSIAAGVNVSFIYDTAGATWRAQ